jgi:hypothetical protein
MLTNMKKLLKDKKEADKVVNYIRKGTEDTKLKEQASMELYQKVQSPITSKLENLEHKIEDAALPIYNKINQLAIEPPTANVLSLDDPFDYSPIKAPKQKTFKVDIFSGVDKNVLSKYNIPTKDISKDTIEDILKKLEPEFDANTKELKKITRENKNLEEERDKKAKVKHQTIIQNKIDENKKNMKILKMNKKKLEK